MTKGSKEIADFIKNVRDKLGFGEGKLNLFAAEIDYDGASLGRIEAARRLPGADLLVKLVEKVREAREDPRVLVLFWLEANGLGIYAATIWPELPAATRKRFNR